MIREKIQKRMNEISPLKRLRKELTQLENEI